MAPDRSADRHHQKGRLIRPTPPDLWEWLGDEVGARNRSKLISDLIERYLTGQPMPPRPWPGRNPDKAERERGA